MLKKLKSRIQNVIMKAEDIEMQMSPLLVQRLERSNVADFLDGRSWLGGLPMLGNTPWPHADDIPMHHLATLDCAEINQASAGNVLPKTGQLAFFATLLMGIPYSGTVRFIPEPADTTAPQGLPKLTDPKNFSSTFTNAPAGTDNGVFPRWPVRFHSIPDPSYVGIEEVEKRHGGERAEFFLSIEQVGEHMPRGNKNWCWDGPQRLAEYLMSITSKDVKQMADGMPSSLERQRSELARCRPERRERVQAFLMGLEDDFAKLKTGFSEFQVFAEDVSNWANTNDRWAVLDDDAAAQLDEVFDKISYNSSVLDRSDFGVFAHCGRGNAPTQKSIATETLYACLTAESEVFEALPLSVQDLVNHFQLRPNRKPHTFGFVGDPYDEFDDEPLLLQLAYDRVMNFTFGDMATLNFYIPIEDLKANRFDAAYLNF